MNKAIAFFFLFLIVFSTHSYAQQSNVRPAQRSFQQGMNDMRIGRHREALAAFREAIRRDRNFVEAYWQMAEVHRAMGNETQRIATLQRASATNMPQQYQSRFRLGVAQFENGLYSDALNTFNSIGQSTARIRRWIEKCEIAIDLVSRPVPFNPRNLGPLLNTVYDDYWPSITIDELTMSTTVLYGRRQGSRVTMGIHEEIFHSQNVDGQWARSENIGPPLNTPGNEGAQSFSLDGRFMFFVACGRRGGMGGCDIYYSIRIGDTWSRPINAGYPLNSQWWETTPSFSPAGNELFFSSNRPGGQGGKDIWKVSVSIGDDGLLTFYNPVNLGSTINTNEDEISPFIHADNKTLYFSSRGHPGLGGYDVFIARRNYQGGAWTTPMNIGFPLNSHRDEMGFVVNARGNMAFFASDGIEDNGRGKDIYEVELHYAIRPHPVRFFRGRVYDYDTNRPIQARIELYSLEDDVVVHRSISDARTGEFLAALPADTEHGLIVRKRSYLFHSRHFSVTDTIQIRLNQDVYLPRIEVGRLVTLNNVFFDFDKFTLRPASKAELDRLYEFLIENPTVHIQLAGHTDSRGPHAHNVTLSQNRARVVRDYLLNKGINPERLTYIGHGPDKPIATNSTDEGRALNRRTEAIITRR